MNSAESLIPVFLPAEPKGIRSAAATPLAQFNYLMAALLGSMAIADVSLAQAIPCDRVWESMAILPDLLPFAAVVWFCHWTEYSRLRDFLLCLIWPVSLSIVSSPLLEMAGRDPFPLVDTALARIDTYMFQTGTVVRWMQHFPALSAISETVYALSVPLILAALFLPVCAGHANSGRRYIFSASVALAITIALFAMWPAAGPWRFEDFRPNERQAAAASYLLTLKSHHPNAAPSQLGNIVSFPSFHTISAVLSAIALWNIRWIRWVGLAVCVGICVATVTTGWHYVIDVMGGLAVAFAAWAAATKLIHD
jgi:membrane-associated phospholipid phosphatase